MNLLTAQTNPFGGRVVEGAGLPADPPEFAARLRLSLDAWRGEGVKVVWLSIPRQLSALIPAAVAEGFVFHHAAEDSLQLTLSLDPGAYVPPFATHYIGAGGVVLREDGRLLVISERYKFRPGRHLKLPGGALQAGEHIAAAVVREVKEETGIETAFESVICLRHWHGYRHGKSDIYFICRLTPLSFDIHADPREIDECLWLPVDDYLADPDVHAFNRRIVRAALAGGGLRHEEIEGYGSPATHEILMP